MLVKIPVRQKSHFGQKMAIIEAGWRLIFQYSRLTNATLEWNFGKNNFLFVNIYWFVYIRITKCISNLDSIDAWAYICFEKKEGSHSHKDKVSRTCWIKNNVWFCQHVCGGMTPTNWPLSFLGLMTISKWCIIFFINNSHYLASVWQNGYRISPRILT